MISSSKLNTTVPQVLITIPDSSDLKKSTQETQQGKLKHS